MGAGESQKEERGEQQKAEVGIKKRCVCLGFVKISV
jgi:hypothetical protein